MSLLQIKIAPEKLFEDPSFNPKESSKSSNKGNKSISSLLFILRDLSGLKLAQI